jgi:acetylornithine/succinyldiaminopimelate/putrescine aminotransferase
MIRILLWVAIIIFILRTLQLVVRITQQPKKRETQAPKIDTIEEAHFEDITDLPDQDNNPTPKE